jgi:dTDP-4-dehydrorhamnose reductase
MLHISTDYVFSGNKAGAYLEGDATGPISEYGRSKLLGEQEVAGNLERHFIVRTSWLFGMHGKNFVDTILRIARQQPELRVVNDQRGSPTYTRHLAEKLAEIIDRSDYGIYHVTGSGNCSWFEFAQGIIGMAGVERVRVIPVTSAEFVRPARRPANSILDNGHLRQLHLDPAPHWEDGLRSYLEEIACPGECEPAGKVEATWKANY